MAKGLIFQPNQTVRECEGIKNTERIQIKTGETRPQIPLKPLFPPAWNRQVLAITFKLGYPLNY